MLNSKPKEVAQSSIVDLVEEIVTVNHAWKVACELFQDVSPLAISMRDLKSRLQVHLLRCHFPEVYLTLDRKSEGEALYSLGLQQPIGKRNDAEHLPVRVAKELLSTQEIERFTK